MRAYCATPGKVPATLTFLEKFEGIVRQWPSDTKQSLVQIASKTNFDLSHIYSYLGDFLDNTIDIHEPLSYKEAEKAYNLLYQRMQGEIEAYKKMRRDEELRSQQAYEKLLEKIRNYETSKNWYSAYKTLSYFAGIHEKQLSAETFLCVCNDCLRLGIKATVNFQELVKWISKGVETALNSYDPNNALNSVEDALDLVDTYKEDIVRTDPTKGQKFLSITLDKIQNFACEKYLIQSIDEGQELFIDSEQNFEHNVDKLIRY